MTNARAENAEMSSTCNKMAKAYSDSTRTKKKQTTEILETWPTTNCHNVHRQDMKTHLQVITTDKAHYQEPKNRQKFVAICNAA